MSADPITTPRLKHTAPLPADGLHFGMSFADYLAAPAVGSHLAWDILVDPLLAWNHSWLNPHPVEKEAAHYLYGQAFHARILEGLEVFNERYYIEPSKGDFEGLLTTDAQVSEAIREFDETPVKGNKPERVRQLLELWDDAPIWDEIVACAARDAGGRIAIKADWAAKFEQSAGFVEGDPDLLELVRSGYSEVSLFWHCPLTGIPKKARADRLLIEGMVDLKTFANTTGRSLRRAIPKAIADNKYPFQPSWYLDGAQVVRDLVRRHGPDAVHHHTTHDDELSDAERAENAEQYEFAKEWAAHDEADRWTWIFVQKGDAPSVVGAEYDATGNLRETFDEYALQAAGLLRDHFEEYGVRPWVEPHGIWEIEDTMIPAYVMEI